jgi:hypothetical protein
VAAPSNTHVLFVESHWYWDWPTKGEVGNSCPLIGDGGKDKRATAPTTFVEWFYPGAWVAAQPVGGYATSPDFREKVSNISRTKNPPVFAEGKIAEARSADRLA